MASPNQELYLARHLQDIVGPVLEVGSRLVSNLPALRRLWADAAWTGVDLEAGPGVDLALDLTRDWDEVNRALDGQRFRTILCLSVLEHCAQPFRLAENLCHLLEPGGTLVVSAPFAWEVHAYPEDFWRFTPQGLLQLFPTLKFDLAQGALVTDRLGDLRPLTPDLGVASLSTRTARRQGQGGRMIGLALLRVLRDLHLAPSVLRHRWLFPPVCIYLIGRKPSSCEEVLPCNCAPMTHL